MKFIYTGYFRFPNGDAAASRVLNNARLLRDLGHEVFIVSFGGSPRPEDLYGTDYIYDGIKYVNTTDIDTHSFKERALRYIAPAPNATHIISELAKNYDAVIAYNPIAPLNIRLKRICKCFGLRYIADLTEWPAANETPGGKYSPIYWQSEYNFSNLQKKIKNIIPISSYLKDYYHAANSVLLPPLIDMTDSKWSGNTALDDQRLSKSEGIRILYAGTPGRKDLLGNLINAICEVLPELPKFQLVVAGVDTLSARKYFENPSYLDRFPDNFVFLGRVPQNIVPSLYHASDFSAIIREPSRKNTAGFPTKLVESMASGCPVLLNHTSDLVKYATDGNNAIVITDHSIESVKDGLRRIALLTPETISNMKLSSKETAFRKFDYRKYRTEMESFVSNLI